MALNIMPDSNGFHCDLVLDRPLPDVLEPAAQTIETGGRPNRAMIDTRRHRRPRPGDMPVHSAAVYADLRRVLKAASIARALDLFAAQMDRVIEVCAKPTPETLAFEVHGLSGTAGMLGFMELGGASHTLQTALLARQSIGCEDEREAFDIALERAAWALMALRREFIAPSIAATA